MLKMLSRQFVRLVPSIIARNPVRVTTASHILHPRDNYLKSLVKVNLHARSFITTKPMQAHEFDPKNSTKVHEWQEKEYKAWLNSILRSLSPEAVNGLATKLSMGPLHTPEKQLYADLHPLDVRMVSSKVMELWDTDAIRSWLEDETSQTIKKSSVSTDFDLEAIKTRQVNEQKKYLKNLFKQSIHFNPLAANCDLRFLTSQVNDPVYKEFVYYATSTDRYNYYMMRAGSGAGKTATILNAIGRSQYLLYVDCTPRESINKKDSNDIAYESFLQFVSSFMESNKASTVKDLTINVTVLCQVFWLSKILVLEYMRKNNKIKSPEEWIFWSTTIGLPLLKEVQEALLIKVKAILEHGVGPFELREAFDKILGKELEPTRDIDKMDETSNRIWLAVDEAQLAFKQWETTFQSLNAKDRRSWMYPLVVYGLPPRARRILAGTGDLDFDQAYAKGGAAKGSSIYNLSKSKISFPYVDFSTAWKTLNKFFDLTGVKISESLSDSLQGRLSHVYQLIAEISKAAKNDQSQASEFSTEEKQQIFDSALANLRMNISEHVTKRFCEVYDRLTPELQSKLSNHVTALIASSSKKKITTWSADKFAQEYKVPPEDLGFLFFSTRAAPIAGYDYVYSLQEPFLVGVLQSIEQVQVALQKFRAHQTSLSINTNDLNQAQMSDIMERAMATFFIKPANRLKALVDAYAKDRPSSWYHTATFNWSKIVQTTGTTALPDIEVAVDYLKEHKSVLLSCKNADGADKESLRKQAVTLLQQDRFLAQSTLINANQLPDFLIDELINAIEAEANKAGEILFMAIKPLDMLLKPSKELGPDALGYFTFQQQGRTEIGMFTFSIVRNYDECSTKFPDKRNTDPENFYEKYMKKTKKCTPMKVKCRLPTMPQHQVRVIVTLPSYPRYPLADIGPVIEVYVNQDNLALIDVFLHQIYELCQN